MKILVAPNSMKGTLNAFEFADALEEGFKKFDNLEITKLPLADGGDGTADVLSKCLEASYIKCKVKDPLYRDIDSGFYLNEKNVAIIEMANASGLKLLSHSEYSALKTSSYGTGQLIKRAIELGAKTILLGLGGSATVDGGMGALMALGVIFYNSSHKIGYGCGATMGDVVFIDTTRANSLFEGVRLIILSDVKNPLLGSNGATYTFAAQKGASINDIEKLEQNLSLYSGVLFQTTGKDVSAMESGGAAGGIGAAFNAVFNTEIVCGANYVLNSVDFFEKAKTTDVIVTGEGKIDSTSLNGKASGAILKYGTKIDKPVYAICAINELTSYDRYKEILTLVINSKATNYKTKNTYKQVAKLAETLAEKLIKHYE